VTISQGGSVVLTLNPGQSSQYEAAQGAALTAVDAAGHQIQPTSYTVNSTGTWSISPVPVIPTYTTSIHNGTTDTLTILLNGSVVLTLTPGQSSSYVAPQGSILTAVDSQGHQIQDPSYTVSSNGNWNITAVPVIPTYYTTIHNGTADTVTISLNGSIVLTLAPGQSFSYGAPQGSVLTAVDSLGHQIVDPSYTVNSTGTWNISSPPPPPPPQDVTTITNETPDGLVVLVGNSIVLAINPGQSASYTAPPGTVLIFKDGRLNPITPASYTVVANGGQVVVHLVTPPPPALIGLRGTLNYVGSWYNVDLRLSFQGTTAVNHGSMFGGGGRYDVEAFTAVTGTLVGNQLTLNGNVTGRSWHFQGTLNAAHNEYVGNGFWEPNPQGTRFTFRLVG